MRIGVMLPVGDTEGPGGRKPDWADIRAMAQAADDSGLDAVWLADHFFYQAPDGKLLGMHEAWTLLSAVAASTSRVQLGTMVLCGSFRDPGLTAKMAATLDFVSGGRVVLGVGAGWHDPEYQAFGLPTDHKFSRFEEWLEIVVRLTRGETVTYQGKYHQVSEALLAPAPERRIPILIAGNRPKMLGLVAEWADAWNTGWFGLPDDTLAERMGNFRDALGDRPVEATVGIVVRDPGQDVSEPETKSIVGTVEELAAALKQYEDLGVGQLVVALEPNTTESVRRLAEAKKLAFG